MKRSGLVLGLLLVGALLGAHAWAQGQDAGALVGTWLVQTPEIKAELILRADKTFTRTTKGLGEDGTFEGTWRVEGKRLILQDKGSAEALAFNYELADKQLTVTDDEGNGFRMERQVAANQAAQEPAVHPTPGVPIVPAALPAGDNLRLPFPLPKTPGGHIVYMQWVPMQAAAAGLQANFPLPKLFVMGADGSQKTPLVPVNDFTSYKDPRWSPDYDRLAFVSDFLNARSACMEDVFVMSTAGGLAVRMTGNELKGPAPVGYGIVTGLVEDNTKADFVAATSPTEINVAAQGGDGTIFHPGQHVDVEIVNKDKEKLRDGQVHRFILPRVMAGDKVWLKLWKTKENGSLHLIQVKPNQVNDVGAVGLSGVTLKAAYPSLSHNPRYIVGMGGMEWLEYRTNKLEMGLAAQSEGGYTPNFRNEREGAANVCLWDMNAGGVPVAMFEATKVLGQDAKDPAVSPDGSLVAVGWGRTLCENLALIRTEDLLANRPNPQVLVPGAYNLPNDMNMWQGSMVGCGGPAWSADGRSIAFAYGRSWTDYNTAQIAVVNADGSGLRQLTNVGINQIACQPCFSPDGRSVAFTVLTGKFGPMKMEQIIAMQFTSDIWVVNVDGTGLRQITNDGASSGPAWGL